MLFAGSIGTTRAKQFPSQKLLWPRHLGRCQCTAEQHCLLDQRCSLQKGKIRSSPDVLILSAVYSGAKIKFKQENENVNRTEQIHCPALDRGRLEQAQSG